MASSVSLSINNVTGPGQTIDATTVSGTVTLTGAALTDFSNGDYLNIYINGKFYGVVDVNSLSSNPNYFTDVANGTIPISIPGIGGADNVAVILSTVSQASPGTSLPDVVNNAVPGGVSNTVSFTDDTLSVNNLAVSIVDETTNPAKNTGTTLTASDQKDGFVINGTYSTAGGAVEAGTVTIYENGQPLQTVSATITNGAFSATFSKGIGITGGQPLQAVVTLTDGSGDTYQQTISLTNTVCFMAGVMVATVQGEKAVETLKIGDFVRTADGGVEAVRWLGRQTVSTVFGDPLRILPIRIKAGAIDENVPSRDLLVSPDHALLIDGVLVHAGALINGTTVTRESDVPKTFTYYHVETEVHSLILAENTPAETFIDNVDRMAFDNWKEHQALASNAAIVEMPHQRARSHRQVPTIVRRRLANRAAIKEMASTTAA